MGRRMAARAGALRQKVPGVPENHVACLLSQPPTCMGPYLHCMDQRSPSVPLPKLFSCSVCDFSSPSPTEGDQWFCFRDPQDPSVSNHLHMHVTVFLDCRVLLRAPPRPGATPPMPPHTPPPACRDQYTSQSLSIPFPKRFLNAFLSKREKKRKKKTMPTAQRP